VLIVGEREQQGREVTWRRYCTKEQRTVPLREFCATLENVRSRRLMDNFADVELSPP
jgi:threonyl-tRNA synthetase